MSHLTDMQFESIEKEHKGRGKGINNIMMNLTKIWKLFMRSSIPKLLTVVRIRHISWIVIHESRQTEVSHLKGAGPVCIAIQIASSQPSCLSHNTLACIVTFLSLQLPPVTIHLSVLRYTSPTSKLLYVSIHSMYCNPYP